MIIPRTLTIQNFWQDPLNRLSQFLITTMMSFSRIQLKTSRNKPPFLRTPSFIRNLNMYIAFLILPNAPNIRCLSPPPNNQLQASPFPGGTHSGSEQPRIGMQVQGLSLIHLLVRSHRPLNRLLHTCSQGKVND